MHGFGIAIRASITASATPPPGAGDDRAQGTGALGARHRPLRACRLRLLVMRRSQGAWTGMGLIARIMEGTHHLRPRVLIRRVSYHTKGAHSSRLPHWPLAPAPGTSRLATRCP